MWIISARAAGLLAEHQPASKNCFFHLNNALIGLCNLTAGQQHVCMALELVQARPTHACILLTARVTFTRVQHSAKALQCSISM